MKEAPVPAPANEQAAVKAVTLSRNDWAPDVLKRYRPAALMLVAAVDVPPVVPAVTGYAFTGKKFVPSTLICGVAAKAVHVPLTDTVTVFTFWVVMAKVPGADSDAAGAIAEGMYVGFVHGYDASAKAAMDRTARNKLKMTFFIARLL